MALTDRQRLTETEIVVADLAVRGKPSDQIANELGLSPKTVERHLSQVYRKLGVRSQTEFVARARGRTRVTAIRVASDEGGSK